MLLEFSCLNTCKSSYFLNSDFRFPISDFQPVYTLASSDAGDVVVRHYPRTCRNGKSRDVVGGQRYSFSSTQLQN